MPYSPEMLHSPSAPNEAEKRQLQRVIIDASARRFQAQKIFLRAAAAIKWVQQRHSVLQGSPPQNAHLQALRQADTTLRNVMVICSPERTCGTLTLGIQELAAITNERITNAFRTADQQAGFWLHDDPSLQTVLAWIQSHH